MTILLVLILFALVVIAFQLYSINSTVEWQFTEAIRQIKLARQSLGNIESNTLDEDDIA